MAQGKTKMPIVSYTFLDKSGEKATTTFETDPNAVEQDFTDFENALAGVTNGNIVSRQTSDIVRYGNTRPVAQARREEKILITYEDTVTYKVYTVSVPTWNSGEFPMPDNSDFLDISQGVGQTLKNAFEDLALSPDGNPVQVLTMKAVGRNT